MKDIHLGIEKKNRLNRISKLRTKLAYVGPHYDKRNREIEKDVDSAVYKKKVAPERVGIDIVKGGVFSQRSPRAKTLFHNRMIKKNKARSVLPEDQNILNKKREVFPEYKHLTPKYQKTHEVGSNELGFTNLEAERLGKMKQKLAVRFSSSFGPDLDAIDSFKKGEDYEGYVGKGKNKRLKFEVTDGGKTLKLHGHVIAQNTPKGMVVSNAGFDTGLTYASLKELGVNAKRLPNGKVQLHNKTVNSTSGQKVTVPHCEVSNTPIRASTKPQKRNDTRRTVTE